MCRVWRPAGKVQMVCLEARASRELQEDIGYECSPALENSMSRCNDFTIVQIDLHLRIQSPSADN